MKTLRQAIEEIIVETWTYEEIGAVIDQYMLNELMPKILSEIQKRLPQQKLKELFYKVQKGYHPSRATKEAIKEMEKELGE